ncbi:hypothetical protein [Nesterenkonia lutea]|uniref:Uncharacterized protein n=1 Tax=Nesterenkonia lutea TaxID=272919 RepID=A0ABR9JGA8_9MICC|nr:hypothetical protein [Nesterenkonia lutea]MBE1524963.1 hypothetical protein [Nesterenkonia lutea]
MANFGVQRNRAGLRASSVVSEGGAALAFPAVQLSSLGSRVLVSHSAATEIIFGEDHSAEFLQGCTKSFVRVSRQGGSAVLKVADQRRIKRGCLADFLY